jgi:cupin fold WbuC family metalloprotein
MQIDSSTLDLLSAQARQNDRKRQVLDLRNSPDDLSQRSLNAMEPGTVVAIHRHSATSETCMVLRGAIQSVWYDAEGQEISRTTLGDDCPTRIINIPMGQWHTVVSLKPGTVIFEAKDGKYEPIKDEDILK